MQWHVGTAQLTRTASHHAAYASQVKQQSLQQNHNLLRRRRMCCACDNPDKPYGESLSEYLCEIRNPWSSLHNLHQGTQLLCSRCVTWFYNTRNPQPDHNAKEMHARCMRHNWTIAETDYRKLPIEQNRKGAFNEQGEIVPAAAAARACSSSVTARRAQTLLHEQASEMHQTVPNRLADASRWHAHTVQFVLFVL